MNNFDEIFGIKAIVRGGLKLFKADSALKVIEKCKEYKKRLLGFDVFRVLDDDKIQPILEYSMDYSSPTSKINAGDVWGDALLRIKNLENRNFLFEIVID